MASTGVVLKKVAVPTAVVAVVTTGLAVAVNMATGGDTRWWWWVIVAGLTAAGFVGSLWQFLRQSGTAPQETVQSSGRGAVAATGTVAGAVTAGEVGSSSPAPTAPSATPAPGSVVASGDGSVAFKGTAGSISGGDVA
ncbi:hypothetical protein ACWIGI_05560 [Nocardia sp. NPDC055321]